MANSLLESESIKEEKSLEKYRHIATRSVSGKPSESSIGYQSTHHLEDDSFIICSDGVHNTISITQFLLFLNQKNGLQDLESQFLKNTKDNYSIITIEF